MRRGGRRRTQSTDPRGVNPLATGGRKAGYNPPMDGALGELVFMYVALAGASLGLLEFGVGALLWAEQKILIAIGLVAAMGGLFLGLLTLALIINP